MYISFLSEALQKKISSICMHIKRVFFRIRIKSKNKNYFIETSTIHFQGNSKRSVVCQCQCHFVCYLTYICIYFYILWAQEWVVEFGERQRVKHITKYYKMQSQKSVHRPLGLPGFKFSTEMWNISILVQSYFRALVIFVHIEYFDSIHLDFYFIQKRNSRNGTKFMIVVAEKGNIWWSKMLNMRLQSEQWSILFHLSEIVAKGNFRFGSLTNAEVQYFT